MVRRRETLGVSALALALLVTACGSDDKSPSSSSGSSTAAAPSESSSAAAPSESASSSGTGSDDASATVDKYIQPPTSINITQPLSKKPPTGKTATICESAEPVSIETNKGLKAAIAALGWTLKTVREGTGAEDPAKCLGVAIDQKPDFILISGNPLSTMRAQVQRAKAANINVIQSDAGEPTSKDGSIYTLSLDSFDQTGLWGKMIADYIATKGGKHVLVIDLSIYPILHAFSEGVVNELKKAAPDIKSTLKDTQVADLIAGKVPSNVVSEIQRSPDIDWVIVSLGDMATGLDSALRTAGFAGKVKIGGESASIANVAALKGKKQDVFTGFAAAIHGWRRADAMARISVGDPLDPNNESFLPTQLLTQDNVGDAALSSEGYYVGFPNYEDAYKKLWQLG